MCWFFKKSLTLNLYSCNNVILCGFLFICCSREDMEVYPSHWNAKYNMNLLIVTRMTRIKEKSYESWLIMNNSDWYLGRSAMSEILSALKIQKGVQCGQTKWCLERVSVMHTSTQKILRRAGWRAVTIWTARAGFVPGAGTEGKACTEEIGNASTATFAKITPSPKIDEQFEAVRPTSSWILQSHQKKPNALLVMWIESVLFKWSSRNVICLAKKWFH